MEEAQVGVSLDETFSSTESYIDSVGFGLLLDHQARYVSLPATHPNIREAFSFELTNRRDLAAL